MPAAAEPPEGGRKSARIATNTAAADAKMHSEALAATKDMFNKMGEEMQAGQWSS